MRKRHLTLQEAQQAAIDEGEEYWERPDVLLKWDVRLIRRMKHWTKVLGAVVGFGTVAGTAVTGVIEVVRWIRAGGTVPPAEMPKGNGIASTALDRVDEPPKQPKAK